MQYIEHELIPNIDNRYKTNGFNILAGHSLGGLFTLHAMQAKPDLFDAHLAPHCIGMTLMITLLQCAMVTWNSLGTLRVMRLKNSDLYHII